MHALRSTLAIIPLLMIASPSAFAASPNCSSAPLEIGKETAAAGIGCPEPIAVPTGNAANNGTGRALCLGLLACLFVAANQASRRRAAPVVLS